MRGVVFLLAACALASACASVPSAGTTPPSASVRIPSTPIDLGDWRRAGASALIQHFEREIAARYTTGAPLSAVSADLGRNDFVCAENRDTAGRGNPPAQICRKAAALENCTHTWQVHLFNANGGATLVRTRALYDRRCGGDGLLGGPG
ncbi:MAG: hypothetical protein ABL883_06135 [Terricaulis sp.]